MDSDSIKVEPEVRLIILITQTISLASSMDTESELKSLITQMTSLVNSMDSEAELKQLITQVISLRSSTDSDVEPKLKALITQIYYFLGKDDSEQDSELVSIITQIFSLVYTMNTERESKPDSVPEPESELLSLSTQIISIIATMTSDMKSESNAEPEQQPESESDSEPEQKAESESESESEWDSESESGPKQKHLISLCPQVEVRFRKGKMTVLEDVEKYSERTFRCNSHNRYYFKLTGGDTSHFRCSDCNGAFHDKYEKAPIEVKHLLHPKHPLQLVMFHYRSQVRRCYCCDEKLLEVFYYCAACDYAMNIACLEKPPVVAIDNFKWHEHTLALFPRQTSLTCNVCALADSVTCPFYMCPPCDFVVHKKCMSLPRVIRISRHSHRISFTHSFDRGDWSCGVCRRKIDNDYGGYSCIKEGCSYAAHSKCATQSNVWDGKDLEGVPEEIEEEVLEPFVRISDGIIQHFSHEQHHMRLDENTSRYYDENKECQACIRPIYFGNFYSCMTCEFILHEACANLSRKMHHPIHAHRLTLATDDNDVISTRTTCSACPRFCTGFVYRCNEEECHFKLHVECAAISEPLVHASHMHPLYLTSKPGEQRKCELCKDSYTRTYTTETFNCIECDYALCFGCATLPQKVRYKHDKHTLALSYGKEISAGMHWCEICEEEIYNSRFNKQYFYMCDEYCCVTVHVQCMFQVEFYMKSGSSVIHFGRRLDIVRNNHMSRPICVVCKKRCQYKVYFERGGVIACSLYCVKPWGR